MNPGCEVSFHNRTDIWAERNATETKFALGTDSKCCFEVAPSVTAFRCTCLCMFHSCCSTFLPAFMIVFHYSTASFLRTISCSSSPGHVGSLGSPPSSATLVHSLDEQRSSARNQQRLDIDRSTSNSNVSTAGENINNCRPQKAAESLELTLSIVQWTVAIYGKSDKTCCTNLWNGDRERNRSWLTHGSNKGHLACLVGNIIIAINYN